MTNCPEATLSRLLTALSSREECEALLRAVRVAPSLLEERGQAVSRAVVSQALNLLLFRDLLNRVPTGRQYVAECVAHGKQVVFDHGALRTVALEGMGDLPPGEEVIARVLIPLGYRMNGVYPLDRLGMTGRSYTHEDLPEDLPQFFVSELHPERFSPRFRKAVFRVTASSRDPLSDTDRLALVELAVKRLLPCDKALALLPRLLACFARQHADPAWSDYETLLAESPEMAWIATEGNAFNHATDRVPCIEELAKQQRRLGRPLKDAIEVSRSGRVRQTAFRADPVERNFVDTRGATIRRTVPGSFYEFIQRDRLLDPATNTLRLDLSFDSGNAQGIFSMTAAA
ncbi:MAG TPA: DUF1338 family protein [Steroidobacteraceae bacterium]|nr:DUF1338 family protein [Steroidobacteraceae bacterium]